MRASRSPSISCTCTERCKQARSTSSNRLSALAASSLSTARPARMLGFLNRFLLPARRHRTHRQREQTDASCPRCLCACPTWLLDKAIQILVVCTFLLSTHNYERGGQEKQSKGVVARPAPDMLGSSKSAGCESAPEAFCLMLLRPNAGSSCAMKCSTMALALFKLFSLISSPTHAFFSCTYCI